MAKNDFQYGGWNSYTLQCGMWLWNFLTVNSPSGSTLQCDMQLWIHDTEFARWQHPAMWQVALG